MKSLYLITSASILLASCIQPSKYTGIKYPKNKTVEVYHSTAEIKRKYHVVGQMENGHCPEKDEAKVMTADAKRAGGDGVIFAVDTTSKDRSKPKRVVAQVIKYD